MRNIHKGWIILFLLVCTMIGSLGFGRFSLGAILPFMREGLGLDYRQIGLVASSAFLGYLVSVSIVGYFVIKFGSKIVINYSLLIISLGMIICANATSFWTAFIGCLLLGLGSGGSSIPAMGLAGRWFSKKKKGMAIGTALGGVGIGVVLSGLIVPTVINLTPDGWRVSCYILALIIGIFVILNALFLKNSPEELGLNPVGDTSNNEKKRQNSKKVSDDVDKWSVYKNKQVWIIGFIYLSWGFSYLVFSTFLVDYLMKDLGYSKEMAGLFFSIAGFASIVSGFVWGGLSDRFGRMFALSGVLSIQFLMLIALTISTSTPLIIAEVILYGLTLWGVPTIMNAGVADVVKIQYVPIAMGFVTIFFSIGQMVSPVVTGFIIEANNNYFGALLLSAAICFCGAITCMWLHVKQRNKQEIVAGNEIKANA